MEFDYIHDLILPVFVLLLAGYQDCRPFASRCKVLLQVDCCVCSDVAYDATHTHHLCIHGAVTAVGRQQCV